MSVFISYSRIDKTFVQNLTCSLDKLSVAYFLDEKDIEWGVNVAEAISDALMSCSSILVVISPASLKSHWVPFEIGQARALGKTVLPLLTHPSLDLPGYLQSLNYKTDLDDVLRYFNQTVDTSTVDGLEEIHERLRNDTSVSGAQRIDMIRQLANGPRKVATKHLEEIAGGHGFYSQAEIAGALAALKSIAEGKQNHDLLNKVEAENPANKIPGGRASLAATIMFWERPGSEGHNTAFEALLRMAKGDSNADPPTG